MSPRIHRSDFVTLLGVMTVHLDIVEGPDAGRRLTVGRGIVVGRDPAEVDVVLTDKLLSRRHLRIEPSTGGAVVEDLASRNGTLVNHHVIGGRTHVVPGDEVLAGVTVMQLVSEAEATAEHSAPRAVPPALARPQTPPAYVPDPVSPQGSDGIAALQRLVDRRVKGKAAVAPLPVFVLAALVVIIYLGLQ
jgi:hypothetical protein